MSKSAQQFWDGVAHRYSKQEIADTESYSKKLAQTQAYMTKDSQVLELGCGTGSTALLHAPFVEHYLATDLSQEMLAIAQQKAQQASINNVAFKCLSIEEIQESDVQYDMVLALNVLHLLEDYQTAIQKVHTLLKPGGLFVSSTVCLSDKMWFMRPIIPCMRWLGFAPYVSFLKAEEIQRSTEQLGFETLERWAHGKANALFMIARKQ